MSGGPLTTVDSGCVQVASPLTPWPRAPPRAHRTASTAARGPALSTPGCATATPTVPTAATSWGVPRVSSELRPATLCQEAENNLLTQEVVSPLSTPLQWPTAQRARPRCPPGPPSPRPSRAAAAGASSCAADPLAASRTGSAATARSTARTARTRPSAVSYDPSHAHRHKTSGGSSCRG